ncbi:hypothetical protein FXW78_51560 [Rhodococcus opacus]|nr:hypothetical protein [Rhodococcus opacus]
MQAITEPPKRGKLVGVGVGATLLIVAIGGGCAQTPVATDSGSPAASTPSEQPATVIETTDAPAVEGQSAPTPDHPTEQPRRNAVAAATATVTQVIDGDTIEVQDDTEGELTIRILGIDTPETKQPGYTVGCWGPEASAWHRNSSQVSGWLWSPTRRRTPRTRMAALWPTL